MAVFTGLGAGTIGDPYQITTLAQFKTMALGALIKDPVFTGSGLNDAVSSGAYTGTDTANVDFTFRISAAASIKTHAKYDNGTGYVVGDTFTINGGSTLALCTVTQVAGSSVIAYTLTSAGAGYTVGDNKATTNVTGNGSGCTISVQSIVDLFAWKKGAGAETIVAITGADITIATGLKIRHTALVGHTLNDTWVVTCTFGTYYKMMNDIDYAAEATFAPYYFNANLDGNGFGLLNLPIGNGGFAIKDGTYLKNITIRYNRKHATQTNNFVLYTQNRTLANITLSNIHVLITGTANALTAFVNSSDTLAASCVVNNIAIEGSIIGTFPGTVNCLVEHIKVLRTNLVTIGGPNVAIIGTLNGNMSYCQNIIPSVISTTQINSSYLVNNLGPNVLVKESFALVNAEITYATDANATHGLFNYLTNVANISSVQDSYFKGNLAVNRGATLLGKAGYTFGVIPTLHVNRCFSSGNVNTPANDNRTILQPESANSATYLANNYYNKTKITSITPKDIAGQQVGLTSAQFVDTANFNTWDFATIWAMGSDGPVLRNNPVYAFESDMRSLNVQSVTRNSPSSITALLSTTWEFDVYGLEVSLDGTIIYDVTGVLSNNVTLDDAKDGLYTLKAYWLDSGVKYYANTTTYQHYCMNAAYTETTVAVDSQTALAGTVDANLVHGSCIYNGYVYGSTRNKQFPTQPGCIVKAPLANLAAFVNYPIWITSEGVGKSSDMDQIIELGGYLYALSASDESGSVSGCSLIQFNTSTNDYKVFSLGPYNKGAPIFTDGAYLYITYQAHTIKVDPADFIAIDTKFNTYGSFAYTVIGSYDHNSQGGHILGGYPDDCKGYIHSACADDQFIYLAFTTRGNLLTDNSGYAVTLNKSMHELHKVNKATMLADSWISIPKATDDMSQTGTHLYMGVEVQAGADIRTFGYGWSISAVRKSDLALTGLPKGHSTDNPPTIQSYGTLVFGNYLFDIRTNQRTHVIDITNVDAWSPTEPIAKRTLACIKYTYLGAELTSTPNEILLAPSGKFYMFLWSSPSSVVQTDIPIALNFFAIPTVDTMNTEYSELAIQLVGYVLNDGGKPIISRGFKWGTAFDALTNTLTSGETTTTFNAILMGLTPGTYFYQAYAINSEGEGYSAVKSFTLQDYHWRIKVVSNNKSTYSSDNLVTSFKNN